MLHDYLGFCALTFICLVYSSSQHPGNAIHFLPITFAKKKWYSDCLVTASKQANKQSNKQNTHQVFVFHITGFCCSGKWSILQRQWFIQ